MYSSYLMHVLEVNCPHLDGLRSVGFINITFSANYKNTTLFWNIFKNATPIFQKYYTWKITYPGGWAGARSDNGFHSTTYTSLLYHERDLISLCLRINETTPLVLRSQGKACQAKARHRRLDGTQRCEEVSG